MREPSQRKSRARQAPAPPTPSPEAPDLRRCQVEIVKCRESCGYFLDSYCQVKDEAKRDWVPFRLWPAQFSTLDRIEANRLVAILKARQLGQTWLVLGYALWLALLRPAATVLLFSRRDAEAVDLLKIRLKGMYARLPPWLRVRDVPVSNDHEWFLSNGSRVLAFPTTAGDSYTATLAVVDEADLVPDLDRLMAAVKPTIDGGGRMILLSRSDKSRPQSTFKRIYSAARQGKTGWAAVFLPWQARPDRDQAWYDEQRREILGRNHGSADELHGSYPATDVEALAPCSLDKRISPEWLHRCYREQAPLSPLPQGCPSIPGLEVYLPPQEGKSYVIGADPAEGNPTSDDSALTVLSSSGEEVAALAGRLQPAVLAAHADAIGRWYNCASILTERNNHGHAVLLWLSDNSRLKVLRGLDGKPGWLSSTRGKTQMYDATADAFRAGETRLHSFGSFTQLASVEGATLRAPEGEQDDRADSYALALAAIVHGKAPTLDCPMWVTQGQAPPEMAGGPPADPGPEALVYVDRIRFGGVPRRHAGSRLFGGRG